MSESTMEALLAASESAKQEIQLATTEEERRYWQISLWRIEGMIETIQQTKRPPKAKD